ncbi:MAG: hypothetical protein MSS56_10155 [Spirochaetia bacterium]|nr:hypothetical protein [Spirochaetia bacterium]
MVKSHSLELTVSLMEYASLWVLLETRGLDGWLEFLMNDTHFFSLSFPAISTAKKVRLFCPSMNSSILKQADPDVL